MEYKGILSRNFGLYCLYKKSERLKVACKERFETFKKYFENLLKK